MKITSPTTPNASSTSTPKKLKMVAVGDSLTAGMQDFNLVGDRQEHSYPSLVARQAGLEFKQPLFDKQGVPPKFFFSPGTSLGRTLWSYAQVGLAAAPTLGCLALGLVPPEWMSWPMFNVGGMGKPTEKGPYDNLAVPGFELRHISDVNNTKDLMQELAGGLEPRGQYIALGPYVKHIQQGGKGRDAGKNEIDQAIEQSPDLAIFWGGNNDILKAALSGEVDDRFLTPMEDRPWSWQSKGLFGEKTHVSEPMPGLVSSLSGPQGALTRLLNETSAEIVVMNIPDVTTIPSMRTLGQKVGKLPFQLMLPDGTDVTKKIENWTLPNKVKGEGFGGRSEFPEGTQVSLTGLLKKFTHYFKVKNERDLDAALLTMKNDQAAFGENEVLDPNESGKIQERVKEFNGLLSRLASENPRLHLVDINSMLTEAREKGLPLRGEGDDVTITNTFTGLTDDRGYRGIFSADGMHPSDVGYAMVANRVLDRVRQDLGDDPRFAAFKEAQSVDEKAVMKQDPHNSGRPTLILSSFVLERMLAS